MFQIISRAVNFSIRSGHREGVYPRSTPCKMAIRTVNTSSPLRQYTVNVSLELRLLPLRVAQKFRSGWPSTLASYWYGHGFSMGYNFWMCHLISFYLISLHPILRPAPVVRWRLALILGLVVKLISKELWYVIIDIISHLFLKVYPYWFLCNIPSHCPTFSCSSLSIKSFFPWEISSSCMDFPSHHFFDFV